MYKRLYDVYNFRHTKSELIVMSIKDCIEMKDVKVVISTTNSDMSMRVSMGSKLRENGEAEHNANSCSLTWRLQCL